MSLGSIFFKLITIFSDAIQYYSIRVYAVQENVENSCSTQV